MLIEGNVGGSLLAEDPYRTDKPVASGVPAPGRRPRFLRRLAAAGARRLARLADPSGSLVRKLDAVPAGLRVELEDPRSIAQLRAASYLFSQLDRLAEKRRAVQARRQRGDRDLLARFPLYLVPTYPGDAELFASPGFRAWLPSDLPIAEAALGEIMELGG